MTAVTINIISADDDAPVIMKGRLAKCPKCGGWRLDYGNEVHSPTIRRDTEAGVVMRVDCVGHVLEILEC